MTAEDSTFENEELSQEARWSYYVSAYTMRDPTEGVPFSQMRMPFLKNSLPIKLEQDEEYNRYYRRLVHQDGLVIRICANSYHILYEPGSYDWWWRPTASSQEEADENVKELTAVRERRQDRFREMFVNNPAWARGLSKDDVDASNKKFRTWINGGPSPEEEEKAEVAVAEAPAAAATEAVPEAEAEAEAQSAQAGPEPEAEAEPAADKKEKEDTEMADAEPASTKTEE
jgi:paired amphipathic helix protein Sin3a